MKRSVFIIISLISVLLAAGMIYNLLKRMIDIPQKYEMAAILSIPILLLIAVISYYIQSHIRSKQEETFRLENGAEGNIMRGSMIRTATNTMETSLFELQILGRKIGGIVGRILVSILLGLFMGRGTFSMFLINYIIVSYCWIFIKATRNYLIGIVAFLLFLLVGLEKITEKFGDKQEFILVVLILGVFVIDIINIIRYIVLRIRITKAGGTIRRLSREEMRAYYRNTQSR
ncbi:MAG: hypothetical protein J6I46_01350 [Ruminococcus sp.]|nr:hypothetical protein [Ruminococcus sp.]